MSDKRQKNQLADGGNAGSNQQMVLAWDQEEPGEARKDLRRGTESLAAKRMAESPAFGKQWMEEVCRQDNCLQALARVKANQGIAGVDGMTVQQLPDFLKEHWLPIREQLLHGTYEPKPVKRVEIPKPGGGVRKLGIPTVLDRFIQQAVMQVVQRSWDRTFSDHSYGFRPGRSAHQAVAQAQQYIAEGRRWVVDLDLEKFFDRVNHDRLMAKLAERIEDKRLLRLIRAFLQAGVMENGLVNPVDEGTPQGGPLSPLLSNIVLDEMDRELEKRGLRFVRYADDCNIYVGSRRAGERVMAGITAWLATKLRLQVNQQKSAVARPWVRKFLGFSFTRAGIPKRRIAPQAVDRFKERVREVTRRTRGISIEQMVTELTRYLQGWLGYFGRCETPSVLRELGEWTRHRLRSMLWKQWKTGSQRLAELRQRGVKGDLAVQTAGSAHGPWRLANSPALHIALPNTYFESLGLPKFLLVQ
jgi:RNA-directed DNA polymerase